ncbi:DUF6916 family protein [Marinimicrobium sp. ARAG 43.8]|uniref:DUF6916 family protein n=1 Tax=Marinimicrobium sp. ARAG 43.8 TaxID=3418719 RepID=UPI003CECC8F6
MEHFTQANLERTVGENVTLTDGNGVAITLRVDSVHQGKLDESRWESFSVTLTDQEPGRIPQGTYQIAHENFGDLPLFVSPNNETQYEIIVNKERK